MKRLIEPELWHWRENNHQLPLIIRGARQVGKSYLIESFGRKAFESTLVVNFELDPQFAECFTSLDPHSIVRNLELYTDTKIIPGKTLLFFDEIQQCPQAITSLRYFKEKMPQLHVIGAGSLLEFAVHDENFSFPVGRVQFTHLRPLSFHEFLLAKEHHLLLEALESCTLENLISDVIHQRLLNLVREYIFLGGMPAVIDSYLRTNSFLESERLQTSLLKTYENDFGKYATQAQHQYLKRCYERSPFLVGKHFQYKKIDPDLRSRELKTAIDQLSYAGLITRVHATSANGIPLRAEINERKFKILFLDVGLYQRAMEVDSQAILQQDLLQVNEGALAEQFVGQELLAYGDYYVDRHLHFWEREKKGSSAEVDYVVNINSRIIPIEVKAGKTGRLRSLQQFMHEKACPIGIRISQYPLSFENNILSLPLYLIEQLPRLLTTIAG